MSEDVRWRPLNLFDACSKHHGEAITSCMVVCRRKWSNLISSSICGKTDGDVDSRRWEDWDNPTVRRGRTSAV